MTHSCPSPNHDNSTLAIFTMNGSLSRTLHMAACSRFAIKFCPIIFPTRFYAASSGSGKPFHNPDTYQKDGNYSEPPSTKTHVVSGQPEGDERTQRPFESPTGAYTTTDKVKPYDTPTKLEDEGSKTRYGGLNLGGDAAKDVEGDDGPLDRGKGGRK
ncbi:hypothetical protein K439DRAFT_1657813 [Ramaria rubella]|nr:hypothetical protein K439DRAFT_1657813 [Ramaria rubella]